MTEDISRAAEAGEKKNDYFAKREKREREERRQERSRVVRWALRYVLIGIGIFVLAFVLYQALKRGVPTSIDQSVEYPIQGRDHIELGSSHPSYNSNPPSSGWHYTEPAQTGFREKEIPDEHMVHSLEHGDIWIAYHPRVGDEVIESLRQFAGSDVVVTSRSANDNDIALVAWGRVDSFNLEGLGLSATTTTRINDFITRYVHKGPEQVPAGMGGGI